MAKELLQVKAKELLQEKAKELLQEKAKELLQVKAKELLHFNSRLKNYQSISAAPSNTFNSYIYACWFYEKKKIYRFVSSLTALINDFFSSQINILFITHSDIIASFVFVNLKFILL